MPADTDHVRRDALHAARSEVRIIVSKFIRRLDAEAKAHIEGALAGLAGAEVDGTEIGRNAAQTAIQHYLGGGDSIESADAPPAQLDEPADT